MTPEQILEKAVEKALKNVGICDGCLDHIKAILETVFLELGRYRKKIIVNEPNDIKMDARISFLQDEGYKVVKRSLTSAELEKPRTIKAGAVCECGKILDLIIYDNEENAPKVSKP
tara:strand:+ start:25 stop:372 length:348 start_codon:yes stop_codon:yes gene_type:complete